MRTSADARGESSATTNTMTVFDDIDRVFEGYHNRIMSEFEYLNLSARPEAENVRQLIESFFNNYPESQRATLRDRLRSRVDKDHISALFELVLHELLLRMNYKVIAIEPTLPNTRRSPDFLVEATSGQRFYLEATLATGKSQLEEGAATRLDEILEAIDNIESPDYLLSIKWEGGARRVPARAQLTGPIIEWLGGLQYDHVARAYAGDLQVPRLDIEIEGMRLSIKPVPRTKSRGISGQRAIGVERASVNWIQPHVALKKAVAKKASRYGNLELPYIVAVSSADFSLNLDVELDALFGSAAVQIRHNNGVIVAQRYVRNPDGLWRGPNGPQNTRVTGVLSMHGLSAWQLALRRCRILYNPWAQHPLCVDLPMIDTLAVVDGASQDTCGQSLSEIFELSDGWPEV